MPPKGAPFVLYDNKGTVINFDNYFSTPIVQQIGHSKIHAALNFERHISSLNLAVASLNVAFKTAPGQNLAHMLFGFEMSDEIQFEIIEGATWTQGSGAPFDIFNNNRNIGGNSVVILEDVNQPTFTASNQVTKNITNISGGINIDPDRFTYNAGLGAIISSESRGATHEWVLKADETYVVRVTATNSDCKMTIDLHWYEHTSQ